MLPSSTPSAGSLCIRRVGLPILLLVLGSACHVERAPQDLDGLARWLWLHHRNGSDEELIDAFRKLDSVAGDLSEARQELISRLQPGDAKAAGASHEGDLPKAAGMALIRRIRCPLDRVEKMFVQRDQKAVHPNYIVYDRTFDTSDGDYFARRTNVLTWVSTYQLQLLIPVFKPTLPGGVRFIPATEKGDGVRGPFFVGHAHFNGPAEVISGGDDAFRQSYQVQIFFERSPGDVFHFYAMWQELKIGFLTSDGDDVAQVTLDSLRRSDDDYENHCDD